MSNRISAFIVVLKEDIHETRADRIQEALKFFDGVLDVQPYIAGSDVPAEITARSRADDRWRSELIELIKK